MRRTLAVAALTVFALAGCGTKPPPRPDTSTPGPPLGFNHTDFGASGLVIDVPGGWRRDDGAAPLVATLQAGSATIALWRYPRAEPLPTTHAALSTAKGALVAAIVQRDPTFTVARTKLLHVGGKRAIQVIGTGRLAGQPRTIRSTHVYSHGAEIVVDQYAPADVFARVDRETFVPVLRSLRVGKPVARLAG